MEDKESEDMTAVEKEEGELEDGELDDEEEDTVYTAEKTDTQASQECKDDQGQPDYQPQDISYRREPSGDAKTNNLIQGEHEAGSHSSDEEHSGDEGRRHRRDKKRRRERKEKKRRREKDKHDKGKKRRKGMQQYVDYDQVGESGTLPQDDGYDDWSTGYGDRHQREHSRYDSPYRSNGSHDGSPEYGGYEGRPRHGRERSPHGPYDSPYHSPAGPFDSPNEDERKPKYIRLDSQYEGQSMMSMFGDEGFVDANVAVNEKEDLVDPSVKSVVRKKKMEKAREYRERQRERDQAIEEKKRKKKEERENTVCKYYVEGNCAKGENCPFSHPESVKLKTKPVLCKHYMRGGCDRPNCIFMHGEYPCKYFYQKKCDMGDQCRFSHAELTPETKIILDKLERPDDKEFSPKKGGNRKPSLLGSPPRHIKEKLEQIKKIPSLFDIKVEPPKKPTNNMHMGMPGGPRGPLPNNMSPNGPPVRGNFYNDLMGSPARMPMMGPGPPPPMRPPGPMGMRPPMMMGPGGPPMGPPPPPGMMNNFYPMPPPPGMQQASTAPQEGQLDSNKENEVDMDTDQGTSEESPDFLAQLPPKQRELFLRIQQGQKESGAGDAEKPTGGDENWYTSDDDAEKKNKSKTDIGTILSFIRQSVNSSSTPNTSSPQTVQPVRDPRVGGNPRSDPRAETRPDPRSQTKTSSETRVLQPTKPKLYDPDKVINASLQHTGGIPYFLYKISVDMIRPMLPQFVDPSDAKYAEDPRVGRYGRMGGTDKPEVRKVASVDPRRRPSGENSPDPRMQRGEAAQMARVNSAPTRPPTTSKAPTDRQELSDKPISLPDGLKKPLIPLPKLLDPRMGRQLSMDKEEKDRHRKDQTSPSTSKSPFSHRNDPRFKKKIKDGVTVPGDLNSSRESDSSPPRETSYKDSPSETFFQKGTDQIQSLGSEEMESDLNQVSATDCVPNVGAEQRTEEGGRLSEASNRKDPMEFASPLGYYSEAPDSYNGGYNSYSRVSQGEVGEGSKGESGERTGGYGDNVYRQASPHPEMDASYPTNSLISADIELDDKPEKSIKEMFNIDPTASPFGTI